VKRQSLTIFVICLLSVACLPVLCSAQQTVPTPGQGQRARSGQELAKLASDLGLSQGQIEQIKPILKATRQQVVQVLNDSNLTDAQKQTQIAELRKSAREQIKPILTPAQLEKWRELAADRRSAA